MLLNVPREGLARDGGRAARTCPGEAALACIPAPLSWVGEGVGAELAPAPTTTAGEALGLAYCSVRRDGCTGAAIAGAKRPNRSSGGAYAACPCDRCSAANAARPGRSMSES
jgi:hypothetical protein